MSKHTASTTTRRTLTLSPPPHRSAKDLQWMDSRVCRRDDQASCGEIVIFSDLAIGDGKPAPPPSASPLPPPLAMPLPSPPASPFVPAPSLLLAPPPPLSSVPGTEEGAGGTSGESRGAPRPTEEPQEVMARLEERGGGDAVGDGGAAGGGGLWTELQGDVLVRSAERRRGILTPLACAHGSQGLLPSAAMARVEWRPRKAPVACCHPFHTRRNATRKAPSTGAGVVGRRVCPAARAAAAPCPFVLLLLPPRRLPRRLRCPQEDSSAWRRH